MFEVWLISPAIIIHWWLEAIPSLPSDMTYLKDLRGLGQLATLNRLIFQLCFIMLKMKLRVCRNLCENFRQMTKNEEVIAYASWVVGWREVYIKSASRTMCREGWGGGTGLNYCFFFHWKTLFIIPTYSLSCNKQTRLVGCVGWSQ